MTDTLEQRMRKLVVLWRADDADDAHSSSLWDQGHVSGRKDCADNLEAALQAQQPDLTNEVIREGKSQWDRVAKILGADGDCVDSVIAVAERLAQQPGAQAVVCDGCDGSGLIGHPSGDPQDAYNCPGCNGSGSLAQQAAAQAVAPEVAVAWQRRIRGDRGKWMAWSEWEDLYGEGKVQKVGRFDCEYRPLYTHPQPPSIPEPSPEDFRAALQAYDDNPTNDHEPSLRDAIRNDRARLRERIGGEVDLDMSMPEEPYK